MIDERVVKIIRDHYHSRDQNNDYGENNLGFGFIHYSLIRNIRPLGVLCIGSQRGYVPALLALACKDNNYGHVTFVDAGYALNEENAWGGIGVWKDWNEKKHEKYWRPLGVADYISVRTMTTEEYINKAKGMQFDYVYIDGDHSIEGMRKDFKLTWPKLKVGGYMLFHDISVDKQTQYGKCGGKEFWQEMYVDTIKYDYTISEEDNIFAEYMTLPLDAGLGIIRKI